MPAHAAFPGANGKIAFNSTPPTGAKSQIFVMNPDGSGVVQLTHEPGMNSESAWSPDGRKIAFVTSRDDPDPANCSPCNSEIYVMDADGSNAIRLTNDAATDDSPAWSPDGTKIVFRSTRTGNGDIYSMNANGGGVTGLTASAGIENSPAWSPDGSKIAFSGPNEEYPFDKDIQVMNVDGTDQINLTNDLDYDELGPDWSPDGTRIAFSIDECTRDEFCLSHYSPSYSINTMRSDGSEQSRIFFDGIGPAWSPDGSRIALARLNCSLSGGYTTCSSSDVVTINPDGSGQTNLTNNPSGSGSGTPSWQPIPQSYARPRGATPLRASLVPAYKQCTSPNTTHGAPLDFPSCTPSYRLPGGTMEAATPNVTVGTPDANGAAANFLGSVRLGVVVGNSATPADEADVAVNVSMIDVRCTHTTEPATCAVNPGASGGGDYIGELKGRVALRITDRDNTPSPGGPGPGTMIDSSFAFTIPCTATSAATIGGTCATTTSADALVPGTVKERARAVWELGQVRVFDGGPDGDVDTPTGNELFLTQGVFIR
jgi:Tol biopolymer transport system component